MDWFDWSSSEIAHQCVQKGPKLSERGLNGFGDSIACILGK